MIREQCLINCGQYLLNMKTIRGQCLNNYWTNFVQNVNNFEAVIRSIFELNLDNCVNSCTITGQCFLWMATVAKLVNINIWTMFPYRWQQ